MTTALLILAVWFLLGVVFAPAIGRHLRRRPAPLPHRPAPGTPPPPGARHRAEHAHTGSISATEVLAALNEMDRRRAKEAAGS